MSARSPARAFNFAKPDILNFQKIFIERFVKLIRDCRFIGKPEFQPVQHGIILAMDAILNLLNFVSSQGYDYLIPGKISQDCLESFFSTLRARFPNPTASDFHAFIRLSFLAKLDMIQFPENDAFEKLKIDELSSIFGRRKATLPQCPICPRFFIGPDPFLPPLPHPTLLSHLEGNAFFYAMGALSFRCLSVFRKQPNRICVNCISSLTTTSRKVCSTGPTGKLLRDSYFRPVKYVEWSDLIRFREYASLIMPSDDVLDIFLQAELIFRQLVSFHNKIHSIKSHFLNIILSRLTTEQLQRNCINSPTFCPMKKPC